MESHDNAAVCEEIPQQMGESCEALEAIGMKELNFETTEVNPTTINPKKRTKKQKEGNPQKKIKISYECSICFKNIQAKKMANPAGCNHYFCIPCLTKWSNKNNTCPLDRNKFLHINVVDRETLAEIMKLDTNGKEIKSSLPKIVQKKIKSTQSKTLQKISRAILRSWDSRDRVMPDRHRTAALHEDRPQIHVSPQSVPVVERPAEIQEPVVSTNPDILERILQQQSSCFTEVFGNKRKSTQETALPHAVASTSNNEPSDSVAIAGHPTRKKEKYTMSDIEIMAKYYLNPFYVEKKVTKEKYKDVLRTVVPKLYKEITSLTDQNVIRQRVKEEVMIWMELL